ncbi:MAG: porin family protein [Acidobacteria bacterium]|nr:MAG: porin family protein [Acidobacteriota bacterium]
MTRKTAITLVAMALVAVAAAAPAQAQTSTTGAVVAVQGGGFSALTNLNDPGTADYKTGFNLGAAAGYQVNSILTVRGSFTFVRAETRGTALPAVIKAGTMMNQYRYGAELQLKAPLSNGVSPYLVAGGGAITFKPDTTPASDSITKPAGKLGAGLNFEIPKSNASVFVEGAGWLYKFDHFGFDKTQFDLTWSAGLSYRFGR